MPQRPKKKLKPGSWNDLAARAQPQAPVDIEAAIADMREQLADVEALAVGLVAARPDAAEVVTTVAAGTARFVSVLTKAAFAAYIVAGAPYGRSNDAMRRWLAEQETASD